MKLVTAVIKPFKLDSVRDALSNIGINGMTVTEVKGSGQQQEQSTLYRGAQHAIGFLPRVKIELAVASDQLDQVVDVVIQAASTGQIGDGKIFVTNLEQVIRIRTVEKGKAAV